MSIKRLEDFDHKPYLVVDSFIFNNNKPFFEELFNEESYFFMRGFKTSSALPFENKTIIDLWPNTENCSVGSELISLMARIRIEKYAPSIWNNETDNLKKKMKDYETDLHYWRELFTILLIKKGIPQIGIFWQRSIEDFYSENFKVEQIAYTPFIGDLLDGKFTWLAPIYDEKLYDNRSEKEKEEILGYLPAKQNKLYSLEPHTILYLMNKKTW